MMSCLRAVCQERIGEGLNRKVIICRKYILERAGASGSLVKSLSGDPMCPTEYDNYRGYRLPLAEAFVVDMPLSILNASPIHYLVHLAMPCR